MSNYTEKDTNPMSWEEMNGLVDVLIEKINQEFPKKNDFLQNGFLREKLLESDDKQFICCYPTSFLPLKTFDTFGHKSIYKLLIIQPFHESFYIRY